MKFGKRSNQHKEEQFLNLAAFALADSTLKCEEDALLKYKAEKMGINSSDYDHLIQKAATLNGNAFIPDNTEEKVQQLTEMIEIALVDGDFNEQEWEYFLETGARLGYSLGEIEHIVKKSFKLSIPKIFYDRY